MLNCQKETEGKNVFICKKVEEMTGYDKQRVHKTQCDYCQKRQEKYLPQLEFNFYFSVLSQKNIKTDPSNGSVLKLVIFVNLLYKNFPSTPVLPPSVLYQNPSA